MMGWGEEPLRLVDLFCGAGGMSLGFHSAGFQIVGAADTDELAAATFRKNFSVLQPDSPPEVYGGGAGDLEAIDLVALGERLRADVVIGGPPCQAYSRVGRAKLEHVYGRPYEEDPRNFLYKRFAEAIRLWQPYAFVMENVPGMLYVRGDNVADAIASDLAMLGYQVGYALLNAAWYGVPQLRERLFFIGLRRDLDIAPRAPAPQHRINTLLGYIHRDKAQTLPMPFLGHYPLHMDTATADQPVVTVREALADLPALTEHLQEPRSRPRRGFRIERKYASLPQSAFAELMRSWPGLPEPRLIDDHEIRRTPRDYEIFRRMRPGDRYPAALRIARQRLQSHLATLDPAEVPLPGSAQLMKLEREFVPPYPEQTYIDKWRKLIPDEPAWTIPAHLAKDSYSHIHYDDDQARMISVREAARLQSLPDAYKLAGNMGDCFRQIGNAVPPVLARAIALELRHLLR